VTVLSRINQNQRFSAEANGFTLDLASGEADLMVG
jgi:hypothetical protein